MKTWRHVLLMIPLLLRADEQSLALELRGKTVRLARLTPAGSPEESAVIFLPGDGGWRGTAVTMGRAIASWGYDVYGFDTKCYLESWSDGRTPLSRDQMAQDVRSVAGHVAGLSKRQVILVGWSQGAGMAVAAVAGPRPASSIKGILTLGLPESAVLGWDWKATVAALARRQPDQPAFAVKPLLPSVAPTPMWMIHGGNDEYTKLETARGLYRMALEPKWLEEIPGANHRFDGHQDELHRSLRKGLAWIASQ